jgi:hypothetical protein
MEVLNNAKKTSEVNDTTYGISVCPRDVGSLETVTEIFNKSKKMELKLERGLFLFLALQLLAVTQAQRRVIGKTKTLIFFM